MLRAGCHPSQLEGGFDRYLARYYSCRKPLKDRLEQRLKALLSFKFLIGRDVMHCRGPSAGSEAHVQTFLFESKTAVPLLNAEPKPADKGLKICIPSAKSLES